MLGVWASCTRGYHALTWDELLLIAGAKMLLSLCFGLTVAKPVPCCESLTLGRLRRESGKTKCVSQEKEALVGKKRHESGEKESVCRIKKA